MKPLYVVIIVVIVAAAGFWGGMTYEKSKAASFAGAGAGGNARYGGRFGGGAGGASAMMPVNGKITASGNNSITVQLSDGSSKIVDLTSTTKINKSSTGSVSDLTTGQNVTAFGAANSDGSITAQAVNVGNGMFRMRTGGPGGGAAGQGGPTSGQ